LHVRVLGIRQSVRGLVFAVQCFCCGVLKLGVMGLSVLSTWGALMWIPLFVGVFLNKMIFHLLSLL